MPASNTQTAPKSRRRSQRGIEAEQKLLSAANEVFWTHGFAGSTIAQIIEASGMSVGSFYHQFEDKSDLLERGTQRVLDDFQVTFGALDLSRDANGTLFRMFYRLTLEARRMAARNRGFYRAISELAQNQIEGFGPLRALTPKVVAGTNEVIGEYVAPSDVPPRRNSVAHAIQLIAMSAMQTELGMGPLYPTDEEEFAVVIARAACGILGYCRDIDLRAAPHDAERGGT